MFPERSAEEIRQRLNRNTHAARLPLLLDHFRDDPEPSQSRLMPAFPFDRPPVSASVLVPLSWQEAAWQLTFIRRTDAPGDAHSGQVAFPGGRAEAGENADQTALREAREEVGLDPDDVQLLGRLHPLRTITNYLITPVVGIIPSAYAFHAEAREVSRIFSIPLAWLANPANRRENERWVSPQAGPVQVVYYQAYAGEVLWGASARITLDFLAAYLTEDSNL